MILGQTQEKISYQHRTGYEVNAAQPLDLGHKILVASGYGKGAALLDLEGSQPSVLWESEGLHARWQALCTGKVGLMEFMARRGANANRATLFCLELTEGRKTWEERGYGVGTVILINKTLAVLSDRGELALVDASRMGLMRLPAFKSSGERITGHPPDLREWTHALSFEFWHLGVLGNGKKVELIENYDYPTMPCLIDVIHSGVTY